MTRDPGADGPDDPTAGIGDPGAIYDVFSTRTVLVLAAILLVAVEVPAWLGLPASYDAVLAVAGVLPVLHLRGWALRSAPYAVYVENRSPAGLYLDAAFGVVGALSLGGVVVWIGDRVASPGSQLLWGIGAACSLVGGGVVLYVLVARFVLERLVAGGTPTH